MKTANKDNFNKVSDYDLIYKHNLNSTQRVLFRVLMRLGKKEKK